MTKVPEHTELSRVVQGYVGLHLEPLLSELAAKQMSEYAVLLARIGIHLP
jgi:hypothetical protein